MNSELIIIHLLFGLLASFSPCLFPLLPSYVALTIQSKHNKKTIFISSLFLILGILTVFLTIGLISAQIGNFLLKNYSNFAKIQALLLILAGTVLIRPPNFFYKFQIPAKLENMLYNEDSARNPYLFNYIVGLSYTFIAAPCAGGIFIAVWRNMIASSNPIDPFLIIVAFSLGAGMPFLFMSLYLPTLNSQIIGRIQNASRK
ncbi:MAG: cytochrome c biogenesis protein CcdA, partial [Candidatus Heimdallarchaeota archaeon]|nr:cytochrome c biogenesis protein CcdA [Candidatus Heimdallarchaeota archaeon]